MVCESPAANSVTSCPWSTSPSARIDTTHSMPPYRVGGTANQAGAMIAMRTRERYFAAAAGVSVTFVTVRTLPLDT